MSGPTRGNERAESPALRNTRSRRAHATLARCAAILGALVLGVLAPCATLADVAVRGTAPPFSASLPDGFVALPGTREGAFAFTLAREGRAPLVVTLRRLRGTVSRQAPDERAIREQVLAAMPGAEVSLTHARAMGFDVPLVLAHVPGRTSTAIASLPSMPNAVQLTVSGGPDDAAEVARLARAVMGSFRARSNWLSVAEFQRRAAARWALYAAWSALALYALAWTLRLRRRATPGPLQIIWLAAAAGAFVAAAGLLASLPEGASPYDPITPALVGAVVFANAAGAAWKARRARSSMPASNVASDTLSAASPRPPTP